MVSCRVSASICFLSLLSTVTAVLPAHAVTLRYAMVIGNNHGTDADGREPYAPLKHAESEATRLHRKLVDLCNFDDSAQRTVLLLGTTRAEVRRAAAAIAAQARADRAALGKVDTLFALFFTGHGQEGELLLNDGPLEVAEIGAIYRRVDADFNIGVFDACNSGSLDPDVLEQKGFMSTPGFNLFRELPEEVLTSTGSVWFVSSGPDQVSYEDKELGGVFTHYFIEALEAAEPDGPGITLERIWHYTREHTVEYTLQRQRHQEPKQYVAKLKTSGPLYFSFPGQRSATLRLAGSVAGTFVLSYAAGQLTEMFEKTAGQPQEYAVYPGTAWLMVLHDGEVQVKEKVQLEAGERLVLRGSPDRPPRVAMGTTQRDLWEKGLGGEQLAATLVQPIRSTLSLDAGYELRVHPDVALGVGHRVFAGAHLTHGWLTGVARLGYGFSEQRFSTWGYSGHAAIVGLGGGVGTAVGPARLFGRLRLDGGPVFKTFDNPRSDRVGWMIEPGMTLGAAVPATGPVVVELSLIGGASYAPVPQDSDDYALSAFVGAGLALVYQVL